MIDDQGYRLNVGIIVANKNNQLFWGRRAGWKNAWQFPQGGVHKNEDMHTTMYRELEEELGLTKNDVEILAISSDWVSYKLPVHLRRYHSKPLCIGQKQKWFLLRLISDDLAICLDKTKPPEFDQWKWVDYWYPLEQVVSFKRAVYCQILDEFAPALGIEKKS